MIQLTDEQQERLKQIKTTRGAGVLPWSHLSSPTQRQEIAGDTIDFLLSLLDSDSQAAEPASVSIAAREIVEVVNKTAISLAVCRHGLIREAEDDETVLPDEAEEEIIHDVLDCLTGEETGCLDPEELSAENRAVLMVQDRLDRAATRMRDKCVAMLDKKAQSYQKDADNLSLLPNYRKQMAFAASALREASSAIESLTLDQEQEKQQQ